MPRYLTPLQPHILRPWFGESTILQSVFGLLGGIGGHPEDALHMKRTADGLWDRLSLVCSGGWCQPLRIAAQSAALGGNVRLASKTASGLVGRIGNIKRSQVEKVRKIMKASTIRRNARQARAILNQKGGIK